MLDGNIELLAVGTVFADIYRIEDKLGEGGMGSVYLAQNTMLGRREALKVLRGTGSEDEQRRFQIEVRTTAQLQHPGIVALHHAGITAGQRWFTMEFIDGQDLSSAKGLATEEVLRIAREVAAALDYAHGRGVVHRDIKPANIMVARHGRSGQPPRVAVADFGIAHVQDSVRHTGTQLVIGSLSYLSPERIEGHAVAASDQYALACTVYELLAEQPVFSGSVGEILAGHSSQPPPALSAARPELAAFDAILARALAKQPTDRFPDCLSFAAALDAAAGLNGAIAVTPSGVPAASTLLAAPPVPPAPPSASQAPTLGAQRGYAGPAGATAARIATPAPTPGGGATAGGYDGPRRRPRAAEQSSSPPRPHQTAAAATTARASVPARPAMPPPHVVPARPAAAALTGTPSPQPYSAPLPKIRKDPFGRICWVVLIRTLLGIPPYLIAWLISMMAGLAITGLNPQDWSGSPTLGDGLLVMAISTIVVFGMVMIVRGSIVKREPESNVGWATVIASLVQFLAVPVAMLATAAVLARFGGWWTHVDWLLFLR